MILPVVTGADLVSALELHGAAVVRGERLSKAELRQVAMLLGEVSDNPYPEFFDEAAPWIYPISNRGFGYENDRVQFWHFDGSLLASRARYTLMYVEKPGLRGELLLASAKTHMMPLSLFDKISRHFFTVKTGVSRRLIQAHPDTDVPMLQVNLGNLVGISGCSSEETLSLKRQLEAYLDNAAVSHTYLEGDLVVVDNAAVLHKATAADVSVERLIYRVTTKYEEPLVARRLTAAEAPRVSP